MATGASESDDTARGVLAEGGQGVTLFSVLQDRLDLRESYFLEASAGTGKTFAIEHLVVRYLLSGEYQGEPIPIDKILVVTYTRAAARELRRRIHANLERALDQLESEERPEWPYLDEVWHSPEKLRVARRRIESALAGFDEVQIDTIHAFCHRMLRLYGVEAGYVGEMEILDTALDRPAQLRLVYDFFRTGLSGELLRPTQLHALLKDEGFATSLLEGAKEGKRVEEALLPWHQVTLLIEKSLRHLRALGYDGERFMEAFAQRGSLYKYVTPRNHCWKGALVLADLLDQRESLERAIDSDSLVRVLDPFTSDKLKKGCEEAVAPDWVAPIQALLEAISGSPRALVQSEFNRFFLKYLEREELLTFQRILQCMHTALQRRSFCSEVESRVWVAIVDEFQDTDPLQWGIFHTLCSGRVPLILVGDPKQSIYAFRQADIYSYLHARDELGEQACRVLGTNHRSSPSLVNALNTLFSERVVPGFFALPLRSEALPSIPVEAGRVGEGSGEAPVEFWLTDRENSLTLARIASELHHLSDQGIPMGSCAVLVSTWKQGEKVAAYLRKRGIRSSPRKEQELVQHAAYIPVRDWMSGMLELTPLAVRRAMGTALMGVKAEKIASIADPKATTPYLNLFAHLALLWRDGGIARALDGLLDSCLPGSEGSVGEELVRREGGDDLLVEVRQLVEHLAQYEAKQGIAPDQTLHCLERWRRSGEKLAPTMSEDALQILTIHKSKGLEFEAVFALGVADRTYAEEEWEERDAEKARHLYVALTRARHRLYIPFPIYDKTPKLGGASPLELWYARMYRESRPSMAELYEALPAGGKKEVRSALERLDPLSISVCELEPEEECRLSRSNLAAAIEPPRALSFTFRPRGVHSYTWLKRQQAREEGGAKSVILGATELPGGAETGIVLHTLLEHIDLSSMGRASSPADLEMWCERKLEGTALKDRSQEVARLLYNGFHTPLEGFSLAEVDQKVVRREMEFLFSMGEEGYMTGIVDLFFSHQGRYYLVDWKSNALPSYDPDSLLQEVRRCHYDLQAEIYYDALKRYLALTQERDFEEVFGGIYFLFLRGMSPEKGNGLGVLKW